MTTDRPPRPLDGIRVFELSIAIAGPMCGRMLAHFGAEVVKVESRRNPDVIRFLGSGWLPRDRYGMEVWGDCGPVVNEFMGGKRSLGLDLKSPDGMRVARGLLERSDVFLSNYSAPAVKALGLDYESVRAIRPDVIYASIAGFGTDPRTPYYDFVAWGPNQAPLVGLDDLTGWADRAPSGFSVFSYPDFSNAAHAAFAVLAALEGRDRTGEGVAIELSQQEATAAMLGPWFRDVQRGRPPRRDGNRLSGITPHGLYPTRGADRWVAIAVFTEAEWQAFAAAVEPEWIDDPRFASATARNANREALDRAIGEWSSGLTADDVAERLQRVGVAAAPVLDNAAVASDPQLRARDFWMLAPHARFGQDLVTGCPIALSRTPGKLDRAGPSFGQDNDYVLREVCGVPTEEIERLSAAGVVQAMACPGEVKLDRPYLRWIRHFMPDLPWPSPGAGS